VNREGTNPARLPIDLARYLRFRWRQYWADRARWACRVCWGDGCACCTPPPGCKRVGGWWW